MNEYDSNRIYDFVKKINYEKTDNLDKATCCVLNTCHIREKATDKVYHEVGRIKKRFRKKNKPIVIIAGCVAQAEGEILLKKEKYIDAVIGPQSYHKINQILKRIEDEAQRVNITEFETVDKFDRLKITKNSNSNVSSFITVQEGCDKFCKFCVVPYTRGPEFSRSSHEVLQECEVLANNGVKEITLLGQNVNAYNNNGNKLSYLIYEISKIKKIKRIRFTTSHPIDFTNDLIKVFESTNKLMPLIHLPVQSGSNKILRSMNRKHNVNDYLELIYKLRKVNPRIEFSSDFIIGYPGETEYDFNETISLIKKVKFINSYSFIFSARPGTPAAKMERLENDIAKARLKTLQREAEQIKIKFRKNLFHKISSVLFENRIGNSEEFFGRDEYSNSVIVKSKVNLKGEIKNVLIKKGNQTTLFGEVIEPVSEKTYAA